MAPNIFILAELLKAASGNKYPKVTSLRNKFMNHSSLYHLQNKWSWLQQLRYKSTTINANKNYVLKKHTLAPV